MTTSTALLCLHADVNGDESRCACRVPPGMVAEEWELDRGQRCRILTTPDDAAWCYAMQHSDGTLHDLTVVTHDQELSVEEARRKGQALLRAAAKLDELSR